MIKHEKINLRQLCIGYFLYSTCSKILSLPAMLAQGCGNLAWLSAAIGVISEVILVFVATMLLKYLPTTSKAYRLLCWLFIPIVVAEVWCTSQQIYQMAYSDLFTNLSLLIFVLTLILMGLFFITRQPRSLFRTGEIICWFFALGLLVAIVPPLYHLQFNWSSLIQGNYAQIIPTTLTHTLFFESATFIFIFGSETQRTNRELRQINLTAIACAIGYIVFMILMVLLFGNLLAHKATAIVEITTASQFITNAGALDWLIATATLAALILRFGLQLVAIATLYKRGRQTNA